MAKYSRKLDHFCYLRYCKAKTRKAQLFWLNMHLKAGDLLMESKKCESRKDG